MTLELDWETIALSLAVAVTVAILTWTLTEWSNRRAFRREKLYELKLETYLDLLSAFDMMIDAIEILGDSTLEQLSSQLGAAMKSQGVPGAIANKLAGEDQDCP